MSRSFIVLALVVVAATAAGGSTQQQSRGSVEAELQRLESGKWDPTTLGGPAALMALFADDFVSVEYGAEISGGVQRKTRAEVFSGPPLPPAKFALGEWQFVHANPDSVVVSYRVKALSFTWQAYATSVWARRNGRWATVFYQASTAK